MDKVKFSYIFSEGIGHDGRESYLLTLNGEINSAYPKIKFTEQEAYKMAGLIVDAATKEHGADNVTFGKTIDCTPTWEGVLPMLIALIEDGDSKGREHAKKELQKIARMADAYNADAIAGRKAYNKDNDDNYKMGLISEEEHMREAAKINLPPAKRKG